LADIFISYARADKARVERLVAALQARGWNVWWDAAVSPGEEFDDVIAAALERAKAVLVVWTPASVASRWVRGEARVGADRGILVPVRFDGAMLPIDARAIHTIDLDDWDYDSHSPALQQVCQSIAALLGAAAPSAQDAARPYCGPRAATPPCGGSEWSPQGNLAALAATSVAGRGGASHNEIALMLGRVCRGERSPL